MTREEQFYRDGGGRLRELRERGFDETPEQFAKRLGMTPRTYLAYEAGRRSRGWTRYIETLGDTGVSFDWLLRGLGQMFRERTDTPAPA